MAHPNTTTPYNGDPFAFDPNNWQNEWLFHSQDNFVNGGALYQKLNPGEAQYSEWSQQMVATMYQNWYNSEPQKMKRLMDAGVNPFVAASGLAGSGNASVAPAPNPVNNGSSDIFGDAANLMSSFGGAFGNIAHGIATAAKLRHEIQNIDADTASIFEGLGFTKLQSKALSVQLKYLDQKEQIGVWQALATFDKTKAEYQNLYAQHRNIIAQYDEIIANIDVLRAQEGEINAQTKLNEALQKKAEAESKWQEIENQFFTAHGYKLGTPIYESIRDMMVSDGSFDLFTFGNTIGNYESQVQGAVENARLSVQQNHIFAIEFAAQNGRNKSDELYGRIGSPADLAGRIAKMGTDLVNNVVSDVSDLFKSGDAKEVRSQLRSVLDNCYEQLEKYPEDSERLHPLIQQLQAALLLSNKEIVEWSKKNGY